MIHTAGCLIIGDEVLGGKVSPSSPHALTKCDDGLQGLRLDER